MKRIDYLTNVLTILREEKIGLLESTTLLAIASGHDTKQAIIKRTGQNGGSLTARIRHLRCKNLIFSTWTSEGIQKHDLTTEGVKLCHKILS